MDSVAEFLEQLSTKNIKLSVSDGAVHCYAPRGALTAEIESGIVFHKNRIIELFKLKSIQNNVNASNELLVKRDSDGYSKSQDLDRAIPKEYPLSVGQKGMLFIQNLHPEMSAYNVPICLRFAGSVDREKLSQAWNLVLKKYPILNSRIREDQGDYIQAIAPSGNHNLVVSVQQEDGAVMTDRMVKDTEIPFNVIDDFLYRITLYSTGNEVSYLLIVVHHLIVDGVSSVLIIQSLVDFYTRLLDFKKINIEPKNGYPDYVRWEQAMLGSKAGKDHERYWQKQLEGQQSVLDIFRVGGLKAGSSYIGKTHVCPLPDTLVELALGFSKKYKIELSALFLSIFQIIIHRYSQEDRIYIGMPVMTRPGDIFAFDVGYYVNMIPLLSVMSRDVRVLDQIRKCQATLLEGLYHSQYPFPLMVEKCSSVKNTKNPIFQVSYAYQNFMDVLPDFDSSSTNSCGISLVESVAQQGDYDLNLEVYQKEGNFSFHYKYNPDVCPESSVVRFAQQYISLFERLLNNPDAFVSDFSLASNDDIYSLLHLSKGVTVTSGPFTCIQDLIDQQALATPDNTAAVYEGQQVTYNHLLEQSDLLATYLQYFGVANDTVVGICMTQSPDVLVSILAVLKAGGAFLPLDPEYPDDRLAYMLEDSGVRLVLTQQCLHHKVRLFSLDSTDVVLVDSHLSKIRAQVSSLGLSLERRVSENQLAYVIYTSGSTGKPKAVGVRHRNLVNHNNFATAHYNLTCSDNQFQFSNHGFDLFVEEIFVALNSGATLVFEKKDLLLDLENLAELIRQHHITVLNVPTAFFHALADAQLIASGLKKIIVGGEKLDREKTLRFLANHPGVEMHNTYGPTETTIVSASCIVDKDLLKKHHSIPIGRPINNTRIYILDNNLQLVPRNIAGELYIAGDGVSKGYINRPELTAEKFIDNPFEPGSVMYRTGDLGRWLDDGNIEYLGRIDTQIKIRGFRVELGEIESRLNTYKDIMDSVVVARGEAGDSHLVAFYVAQATQANKLITLDEQSLRAYLAEQLPEYMLPVAYVSLEHIPLTPNGKVDRRCLELQEVVITSSHSYVAASTDTEKQLVTLWAQVLKRDKDRIGIHDNFFELGGHSLMATQLLAKLRQQLGVNLPLKKLFDYPTIFRLAHAVDDDQTSGQVLPVIPVIDRHQLNRLPLSFAQERLWFTHQLDPNSGAYNIPGAIRLTGGFSLQELDLAFATLITRHEILRTVFPSCDGVVEQEIKPGSDFQIDFRDISDQPDVDLRESRTQELCEEEAARPFDLAVGPLMRCLVIKREDGDHVILLNMHHIISDGWSLDILIRELSEVLSARREEREARLAPLPIQYVDYCVWQREYLREGPELSRQMGYWTQQLANAPESLALPTDFPRPKEQSYKGATHAFTLDKQTTAALKALSEAQGCTLYMTVLAVANVLFYRYSGQSDICVGSPIANRQHAETESVMGLFVNTLVFRNHVNGEQPFVEFLQQVKEVCLQAYAHQDIPFEKLVEVLQPHRNPAINPLFQVMLAFQNAGETENYNNSTKSSRVYELPRNRSKFDLTVEIDDTSDEISGVIEYSTRLFTSSRIARMASHFCFLCGSIVNDENVPLHALNIISEKEKNILNKFQNPTATLPIPSVGIQQLLLEQVHKTPSAAAIVCEDESLSYTEFYERSLELALYLQSLGCNPDDIVGICMNSPIDLLVGLWGVILAGSAYVIFDPKNPKERLLYLIEDSRAQIILSDISEKVRLTVGENEKITIIEFGDNFEIIKTQAQSLIESGCRFRESQNPDNLVYLVYTSGSTGNPKGAANFHRGFANLNQWYIRDLGLSSADRILVISNPSFDLTQKNFVAPLLVGASIYLVKEYDPFVIRQIIHREKISWINCAPSSFYGILEAPYSDISSLTTVVLGGEPIQTNLLTGWFDCGQNVRLINSYGPSEASDVVTSYTYDALSQVSLIGKPIKNVEIYILDCYQKSQPIGIPGEIYVGGIGVSRGYINRPELTAEKFIDNPFEPGSVMYRTGDLGRWLDDGNIEYLGRIDTQIKIRGFRVELGEIESRLNTYKDIMDSVVVARGEAGDSHLVAFYVAQATQANKLITLDEQSLRAYLAEQLPEYMLPVAYVSLEHIPLTPNGKVDRRCLELQEVVITSSHSYVAASTDTEKQLVMLWAQVLKRDKDRIGIHDNFFELGGHSLMATQLLAKLRQQLGVNLPLKKLFDYPTIFRLAHAVDDDQTSGQVLPVIPVIDRHQLNRLPLSFAQERLWFIHQLDPNSGAYNIPGAIRLTGHFSLQELDLAFATLITRHEILRTVFPSCDGVVEQEIKPGSDFQIDFRDISDQPDVDLRESCTQELCEEEAARPFDLAVGPLMRCLVIKREDGDHVILLNMHHIISDGWSLDILIRELSEVLSARREEREARLAPLPIQYVDYCVWQREYLREGPELSRQMGYWTQQLANAPESLALPTDFPRPKEQSYKGATHAFTLDKQTTAALKALSDAQGCTLYMTVLAVANVLFYRYSGQSDICVGSPIANRQHAETESVMGLFVNTLVFRNHVNGEQPFVEFLQQVKEVCLQAYAHQDIPFEKLVEVLQPHRNPAINPLFQVMLAMRQANVFQAEPDLMEGESESYNISSSLSNFDLTIDFIETNDTLLGHIEYSSDLFKSETISRLTDHFQTLCRKLIEQPFQKIGATFFLSNGEKESLLKFGKGPEQLDQGVNQACLHDLFKEQVLRTPNATALEYRDEKISYQTLYDRSENLAYHLKSLGVGPDILVGILIDKCPNMIIGILGILQAGGAYLPLDSEYPAERLSYMVDDSHVSLIVSEKAKRESIAQIAPAIEQIICVDEYFEQFGGISAQAGFDDDDAERVVKPNNLAYVIYTSGSTGKPKGVEIEHASAVNHSMYIKDILGLTSEDRQLQVSNMGFDLFVEEVFVALNSGVTLVLSNRERVISFENLAELIELESISILNIPTAFFHAMVDERFAMKNVKKIIVGGEKLIHEKAYQFTSKYPDIVLINTYGPTEATVTSTTVVVDRLLLTQYPEVPIGRPIANTQLYILDDNLNYTPLGVPGDLYIGGKGLARGYLNRQDLTQTCFVDNPFLSGERMYKTGDIARWLEDGNIDYIGRADTQIKIRGFRVELGEVENRLQQFNEIKDSVVVVNKSAGRQVLVAFYVANSSKTSDLFIVDTDELQSFVAEVLPDYMVPVAYISLPSIPLTPNGKVDRKALSCYEVEIMPRELYQPASNETESALVEIWSELFQCDESAVGIRHNFFDLGGHSILAVQLAAKINKRFGAKFPLGELFSSSTIEKQAVFLERKITKPSQLLVEIQAGGQEVPIFLIPGAGGSVMFLRHLGLALGKNQPVYALQYEWSDNENVAIEALAKKYIAEIRRRKISSPYRLAGYSFGGAVAYEMANQLLQSNESVEELIVVDSIAPKYAKKYLKADDHSIVDELLQYVCGVFEISMSSIANNSEIINLADIKSLIIKHSVDQNMDLDGEQIDKLIQSFICDSKAYDKYDPAPVHEELRAVLFKATKNAIGAELPGDYGWGALLRRGIDIRDIHADHISILNSNHANTVAEAIFSWRKR